MDIWDGVKKGLKGFAPILANAVVPGSGGMVAGLVSSVLGCENEPESIAQAIASATPEQRTALIGIQTKHEEKLIELGTANDKLYLADRADARERDENMIKAGKHNYRADIMILVAFMSFCLICYMINVNTEMKPGVLAIFNMAIGSLLTMLNSSFQFEFGSSKGSKEKDKNLNK